MSSLNTLSSSTLVHLVFEQNGKRTWFNRTDRRYNNKTGVWSTIPVVGSEPSESNSMSLEMAVVCQRRWREMGIECRFALEPNGSYVDPEPISGDVQPSWKHVNYLVTVTAEGQPVEDLDSPWVYEVRAVNTPNGRQFVLKFESATLQKQSQFSSYSEGPEACVQRAFERGYTQFEKPKPNPTLEARRREAQRQAQQSENARRGRFRPGDIS